MNQRPDGQRLLPRLLEVPIELVQELKMRSPAHIPLLTRGSQIAAVSPDDDEGRRYRIEAIQPRAEIQHMDQTPHHMIERLARAGILPVIRAATAERARDLVGVMADAGLTSIELTTTIPDWADLLCTLTAERPELSFGMGTITTEAMGGRALEQGAQFLVTPYPVPAARAVAAEADRLMIGGGLTPAELAESVVSGVGKLFPAHVGGISYLKSLLAVLPGARIIPTGGIAIDDAARWLEAGAFAVGVGSDLYSAEDISAKVAKLQRLVQSVAT